jgi:hypothetical protein
MGRPSHFVVYLAALGILSLVSRAGVLAQQPPSPEPPPDTRAATISYQLDSPQRDPARFTLTIDSLGHATYEAEENTLGASAGERASSPPAGEAAEARGVYRVRFDVSTETRDRIFALAQQLGYFHGDYEFRKHRVANTGLRTITYRDGERQSETSFHWSENRQVQEVDNLCESIATTQSFARRLAYLRRYDKLGLEAVLKRMEEMEHSGFLGEVQAIAPLLRQLAADQSVMHVARERAQRLLDRVPAEPNPAK